MNRGLYSNNAPEVVEAAIFPLSICATETITPGPIRFIISDMYFLYNAKLYVLFTVSIADMGGGVGRDSKPM